jgi:protein-tyrosine phosphatase
MQTGRIDVHSHLLPGIDDGCSNDQESIEAARALVDAGYTHTFCTPHVWPSFPKNNIAGIRAAVAALQMQLNRADVPLKVIGGGELNLLQLWPQLKSIPDSEIVTYGLNSRYVLFDFWMEYYADCKAPLEAAAEHLLSRGYKPILAHPERIGALQRDQTAITRLTDLGVLLQLNSWCLGESASAITAEIATRLLKEGQYFLIGTDLHKPSGVEMRIAGIELARNIAGTELIDQLTIHNPRLLMPAVI